ncbi:MAG: tRNA (adenosine(37)-N6)-dimethylallyltransferase MiaA [Caldiserica bacterium]|nr:tRNA (adenosine(37)-N6)-dimethylallyltransferase MiaA [Caldisericota bacterium]
MGSETTNLPLVVGIVGATGTGKTELSLQLARRFGGSIISADSMQVYQGMDIGTAKPSLSERVGVPHALIDVVRPDCHFSVAEYQVLALEAVNVAIRSERLPILVGGTGLYVRAVLDGYEFLPEKPNASLRNQLRMLPEGELRQRLKAIDPLAEREIAANDSRRLERALEMVAQTGGLPSVLKRRQHAVPWRVLRIGLRAERAELYGRLDRRVDAMISAGMEDEVRRLLAHGLNPDDTAMQGIGYKELSSWIRGEIGHDEAIELWKRRTRNYAKRQETWFRTEKSVHWINVSEHASGWVLAQATALVESAAGGQDR